MLVNNYLVQDNNSHNISHKQRECISCASAKIFAMDCAHDVRVLVDEFQEVLQAPEEAFAEAHNASR